MKITGPDTLEYPEYDGNNMYRTLGNIARNPNVGLLFVRFDGKSFRTRIRGRASLHDDAETMARHHGAKLVVRVACEMFPNCPRYVPDMMGGAETPPPNVFTPRPGHAPPPPEWKSRDYLKDVLSIHDPHHPSDRKSVV